MQIQKLLDKYGSLNDIAKALDENPNLLRRLRRQYSEDRSVVRKRIERFNKKYNQNKTIPKSLKDIQKNDTNQLVNLLADLQKTRKYPRESDTITEFEKFKANFKPKEKKKRKKKRQKHDSKIQKEVKEKRDIYKSRKADHKLDFTKESNKEKWDSFNDFMSAFKFVYGEHVFDYLDSNRVVAWFDSTRSSNDIDTNMKKLNALLSDTNSSTNLRKGKKLKSNIEDAYDKKELLKLQKEFKKYLNSQKFKMKKENPKHAIKNKIKLSK